jgi:hypothetical protein
MRRLPGRLLALVSLGTAVAAGVLAVLSALGASSPALSQAKAAAPELASRSVPFGHSRVVVDVQPTGRVCFRVTRGSSTVASSCVPSLAADAIAYAQSRRAVGGVAGTGVRAVIVKLTRKGTVWATLRRNAFYAEVPKAHEVRAVIKVLADGSRRTFTVTGPR